MNPKSNLMKLKPLLSAPSFTSRDARLRGVSSSALAYYITQHKIVRIGHGIYRGINTTLADDFRWEDLIEAMQRVKDGVICLTTALSLYDLTDEISSQHWIAIRNETRHRAMLNTKIVRMRNLILGKSTIMIANVKLAIFDRVYLERP
jgi:predicted transcriptional regulator of viral defense system